MSGPILLDTGPLVALLNQQDRFHQSSKDLFAMLKPPLYTCESVISEACFLVQKIPEGIPAIVDMVSTGLILIPFQLSAEAPAILSLLIKYADVPMSLADGCLVRMSELMPQSKIFTFDSDFGIYRKNRHEIIQTIVPN
jgi:predicted nucleic acid-binding protein